MNYVAGLMFNRARTRVALIRKTHPPAQAGRVNAVGGKIQPGETPHQAMVREFAEEAGATFAKEKWGKIVLLNGDGYVVHFFVAETEDAILNALDRHQARGGADGEAIEVWDVDTFFRDVTMTKERGHAAWWVRGLDWIMPLVLDDTIDHAVVVCKEPEHHKS